jgi:hypothetical protein
LLSITKSQLRVLINFRLLASNASITIVNRSLANGLKSNKYNKSNIWCRTSRDNGTYTVSYIIRYKIIYYFSAVPGYFKWFAGDTSIQSRFRDYRRVLDWNNMNSVYNIFWLARCCRIWGIRNRAVCKFSPLYPRKF